MYVSIFQDFDIIDEIPQMGSLNMSVVELDEPRHVRHIANLIQDIQFKRDLLQVGDLGDSDGGGEGNGDVIQFKRDLLQLGGDGDGDGDGNMNEYQQLISALISDATS